MFHFLGDKNRRPGVGVQCFSCSRPIFADEVETNLRVSADKDVDPKKCGRNASVLCLLHVGAVAAKHHAVYLSQPTCSP